MIRITTQFGDKYDLHVQSVNYDFSDMAIAHITAGDPEYTEEEEQKDTRRVQQKQVIRFATKAVWIPYTS